MRDPYPRADTGDTVIRIEPGTGNLDVRAYIAALLGPQRAAFGTKSFRTLSEGAGIRLGSNSPAGKQVSFIAVTLGGSDVGGPRIAIFDGQSALGASSIPASLNRTLGSFAGTGFSSVLLPGDELYAQSAPGEGTFNIVVSQVWF